MREHSRWQQTLPIEPPLRRYSEYHAELEAAAARWAASLTETPQELIARNIREQTTGTHEVVAPTSGEQSAGSNEVVARTLATPPTAAQVVVAPTPASQPIQASSSTQTVSSMLQSFAFDDTRSGYDDDSDYPL